MYSDLERILSACLYLHVSCYPGVVNFCRHVFSHINAFTSVAKVDKRYCAGLGNQSCDVVLVKGALTWENHKGSGFLNGKQMGNNWGADVEGCR
jgi:hypothetical protein